MEPSVGQLHALLAVAEQRSFTKAGHVLGLTQSAVSRSIAALEHGLGGPLVHRSADGATLTVLGEQVVEHARIVTERLNAIAALVQADDEPQLRVGAIASALVGVVPHTVDLFERRWPPSRVLTVQGDDDELAAWFASDTVDLITTSRSTKDSSRSNGVQLEIHDEFLAVLPRRHPLAHNSRVALDDLVAAGVADPGGTCGPLLAAGFAAHGVLWRPEHVVRDVSTVLAMAAAGITAGVIPQLATPSTPPPGISLLSLEPPLHRSIYIRHHAGHRHAESFTRLLVDHAHPSRTHALGPKRLKTPEARIT